MALETAEIEKAVKELVSRHRDFYDNTLVGYIIAEMVVRTQTEEQKSQAHRYKQIMNLIFGRPEEKLVGEKDIELLKSAAHFYRLSGYHKEEVYAAYKGTNESSTPEGHACREAAKAHIFISRDDPFNKPQHINPEDKYEIDKISKRILPKFKKDPEMYLAMVLCDEGLRLEIADNDFEVELNALRKDYAKQLEIIDIAKRKIIDSIDFNYLDSRT